MAQTNAQRQASYRVKRKAAGDCIEPGCGNPAAPYTRCETHRLKAKQAAAEGRITKAEHQAVLAERDDLQERLSDELITETPDRRAGTGMSIERCSTTSCFAKHRERTWRNGMTFRGKQIVSEMVRKVNEQARTAGQRLSRSSGSEAMTDMRNHCPRRLNFRQKRRLTRVMEST